MCLKKEDHCLRGSSVKLCLHPTIMTSSATLKSSLSEKKAFVNLDTLGKAIGRPATSQKTSRSTRKTLELSTLTTWIPATKQSRNKTQFILNRKQGNLPYGTKRKNSAQKSPVPPLTNLTKSMSKWLGSKPDQWELELKVTLKWLIHVQALKTTKQSMKVTVRSSNHASTWNLIKAEFLSATQVHKIKMNFWSKASWAASLQETLAPILMDISLRGVCSANKRNRFLWAMNSFWRIRELWVTNIILWWIQLREVCQIKRTAVIKILMAIQLRWLTSQRVT